jgi:ERCC4-type nuclease
MKEKSYQEDTRFLKPYVLKPTIFPPDFVLVQDTREQRPLFTRIPKGLTIMSTTLTDGDYSVFGLTDKICFERKSLDIFSYCTSDQPKTKAKMLRMKEFEFAALVIELKESELFQFQQHTKAHPESIRGALISFEIRYNIHIFYGNRENCARWLLDRAVKFWQVKHEA